jgi:hypothetical protein
MKFLIFVVKFLVIGALFLVSNNNLYLSNVDDRAIFLGMFGDWIGNLYGQTIEISGYVVNSEWLPENVTSGSSGG